MPIESLSKKDLEVTSSPGTWHQEYVGFLDSCRMGNGGRLEVANEGASRQTVKNRLKKASDATGKKIKFLRSPATQVIFQVVE